jgi:Tfp pilus assembly protein PilF
MSTKARALLAAFLFTAAAPSVAAAQQKPAPAAPASALPAPSKEARPALAALQKAADENRVAELPALAQAALAVAKTPADRYYAYQLQLRPAIAAKNDAMTLAALEGMIATGLPKGAELANVTLNAARLSYNAQAYDKANTYITQSIALDANSSEAHLVLAETQNRLKKPAEAVASFQKAIALDQAAGKPVRPEVAERALAIAYNNRLPVARELAFAHVKAAPTAKNWRTAIKITDQVSNLPAADKIDLFRLQRATGSFEGEGDYFPYVDALLTRGLPGEAKAVLDEAFAAKKLDSAKSTWKEMHSSAAARVAADKASLAAGEKGALTAATARPALATGDAFMSYGDYAKAAALYRAALGKSGVDTDLANLRLGIALARSGDKAGATTALNAVKGTRANVARLWLLYLQTQA